MSSGHVAQCSTLAQCHCTGSAAVLCSHAAGPYKDTVNLPQTSFSMRANSVQREPQIQKFWQDNKVYESCLQGENKVTCPR